MFKNDASPYSEYVPTYNLANTLSHYANDESNLCAKFFPTWAHLSHKFRISPKHNIAG